MTLYGMVIFEVSMFCRVFYIGCFLSLVTACASEDVITNEETHTAPTVTKQPSPLPQPVNTSKPATDSSTINSQTKPEVRQPQTITLSTKDFNAWVASFKKEALAQGISESTFNHAFKNITPDMSIIKADRAQPEFIKPVWEYLNSAVSDSRVSMGKKKIIENAADLKAIEQAYNVDYEVVVAIWGMESAYGSFTGNKQVIRSLATLAYEGRREDFAKAQLIAALKIIEHGDVTAKNMLGSWAGAMGQTQFIPTSYLQYAVDFDGDGKRNIWTSNADALASTANYLASFGWQQHIPWGYEVKLPADFDYAQADVSRKKPAQYWASKGVTLVSGESIPTKDLSLLSAIIIPAGARGPAFIAYPNFFTIMRYNNSTSYALAVSLLMDSFKGKAGVMGAWPVDDAPLSKAQRIELQTLLNDRGYSAGVADGIIGANTRRAIREFQIDEGLPADGYASYVLLTKLK